MNTMDTFEFSEECHTRLEVKQLLTECEHMFTGVNMIQELSPKSLDQLVSYGERCSGKLCYSYVVVVIFGRRGRGRFLFFSFFLLLLQKYILIPYTFNIFLSLTHSLLYLFIILYIYIYNIYTIYGMLLLFVSTKTLMIIVTY